MAYGWFFSRWRDCVQCYFVIAAGRGTGRQGGVHPPFTADFFNGVVLVELIMMIAFIVAVIMAIVKRKDMDEHALWLITTVFIYHDARTGRGMIFPVFAIAGPDNWLALAITSLLIITALVVIGMRLKRLTHPAILLGVAVNIPTFFVYWLGRQPWYVSWLQAFMKYE
jgi:phosphoglycerol transferase MdoB-like AlkP superfamily enzyme